MKIESTQLSGYAICLVAFLVIAWSFYPGLMTPDSIASLSEGRSGEIFDQNSPVMSYLLGWLDRFVTGTGLLLILQLATFWAAIAMLWNVVGRVSLAAGIAIVAFPFMPQILSELPVIWKDVGMAIALLMSVALLLVAKKKQSKTALLLSPLFLFYGFAARLNSLPAVLPIAIWTGFIAFSIFEIRTPRIAPLAAGAFYFALLFGAVMLFNAAITQGRTAYPIQYVLLHDLAAISIATGEPRFPDYVTSADGFSMDSVREKYQSASIGPLVYVDPTRPNERPPLTVTMDGSEMSGLRARWWSEVTANPTAYFSHRINVFAHLLGVSRSVTNQYADVSNNPPEFAVRENAMGKLLTAYFGLFRRPAMQTFFRSVLWVLASLYLAYRALRARVRGDWDLVLVLTTSGVLYVAAYFPTAPATDYRYTFWPALAAGVAAIFGIYLLRKEKKEQLREV